MIDRDSENKRAKLPTVNTRQLSTSDSSSSQSSISSSRALPGIVTAPSLKSPRTARFAEATAVNSPIDEPPRRNRLAFATDRPESFHYMPQPQVSDVGFGYVNRHESVEMPNTDDDEHDYPSATPRIPLKSPLKSAMKTPGAAPRDFGGILSPTFREEDLVEKAELHTAKEQKRDVAIKARVRLAKFMLRGVNFSCSLIVLAMLATTFSIFNATKSIPPRNNLPPWAINQKVWPQIVLICISGVSLLISVLVFYGYYRGGHARATKYSSYYSWFAMAWFVFSVVMWLVGAAILQSSRSTNNSDHLWGWACNQNARHDLFQNDVSYDLICRLQNWGLMCCIIEVVVETITIAIYVIVFYRFYSKNQLRKAMNTRDRARSDLYMAQLRTSCAPPTPGFNIPYKHQDEEEDDEDDTQQTEHYAPDVKAEQGVQYISADQKHKPAPFKLQAPPIKTGQTPKLNEAGGFSPTALTSRARTPSPPPPAKPQTLTALPQQHQALRSPSYFSPMSPAFPYPLTSPGFGGGAPHAATGAVETQQAHFAGAPGEQIYDEVAVPGAYEVPMSPGPAPEGLGFSSMGGGNFRR